MIHKIDDNGAGKIYYSCLVEVEKTCIGKTYRQVFKNIFILHTHIHSNIISLIRNSFKEKIEGEI